METTRILMIIITTKIDYRIQNNDEIIIVLIYLIYPAEIIIMDIKIHLKIYLKIHPKIYIKINLKTNIKTTWRITNRIIRTIWRTTRK